MIGKNIVLLNPPLTKEERGASLKAAVARSIPYGLISLASVIRALGYKVFLLDATNLEYGVEETVHKLLAFNPDYVGISVVTLNVERADRTAKELKKKNKSIKIIVGGPHLSSTPEETMGRFSGFDVGVIGEGEETAGELLTALDLSKPLKDIKGIIYRDNDTVVMTERRPFIRDCDVLPMPAWDLLKGLATFYRPSAPSYIRLPSTTIVTSRGCPGNCTFCNSRAIFGGLRCFSADYVIAMMECLIRHYGIRDISIYDDNFIFHRERVKKICNTIMDKKLNISWSCYSRVDQGNTELFRLMKRAGCWQISYGIESGSQRILDAMKKNVTLAQIEKTLKSTKSAGLRTRGFFMIGNIGEDESSILETLAFMKKIPLDDFHFTYFTPLPGTVAYDTAQAYGTFDKTWSKMNLQYPVFIPTGLTASKMEYYSRVAYRTFYFRPRILASYLWILMCYPNNITRLINALRALLSRIFSRHV
jgi:radical SAM superfamily enzyme YgiQ (UPF0313 family)